MNREIKHKLLNGKVITHACDLASVCIYCDDPQLVAWTYQNCGICGYAVECLFKENLKMTTVQPSQLSINIATIFLREIDPDGSLGLEPILNMETFKEMEEGEIVICEDIFEEFPGGAAFLLVRDALLKMVTLDKDGDPETTMENHFWVDRSGVFRDAAFAVVMAKNLKTYQQDDYIGASFRLRDGKIAATLRLADELEQAKMKLVKAFMKKKDTPHRKEAKDLLDLLGVLG